ncbi:hypothetical protein [Streptomyces sp. R35]|uniref:DUF1876 domain-containing protein n=1 Tax=Streptomyces sp. R35 TaxID=3238630 RepID=A0AB39SDY1_9ACTN
MPHTLEWTVRLHLFEDDEGTPGSSCRAMNDLARQLLKTADRDIEGMGAPQPHGREVAGWPT